jgi:hypothetical protein
MSPDLQTFVPPKQSFKLTKYLRYLRYKLSPWVALAIFTCAVLCGSSARRAQAKLRWAILLCKIDFVGVQGLLNDLLW